MPKPLSELTTIRVGGTPARLIEAGTTRKLYEACLEVWKTGAPWLLLGGGSNIVVADDVGDLQVVQARNKGIEHFPRPGGRALLRVQAGESWDGLVEYAVTHGLTGIEALSGIPGTVGASPVQNIGAYGQEVSETITRLEFLDYRTGEKTCLENADLGFAYRDSAIKRGRLGAIGWVEFELERTGGLSGKITSEQICDRLGEPPGTRFPLRVVRETVLELRSAKGMVVREDDPDSAGCGSFFTNPVVSGEQSLRFPSGAPRRLVVDDGSAVQLSAAWLIEHAGIERGFGLPGSRAAVSRKHTLAIVNTGGASAAEIVELARHIQERVAAHWGIHLVPEPNLIGF